MEKMNRTLLFALLLLFSPSAFAQLRIGVFGDANKNLTDLHRFDFNFIDHKFSHTCGGGGYLSLSYDMNKWFSARVDIERQIQKTQEDFFYIFDSKTAQIASALYAKPSYLLPVMGGVHYEFNKWRIHEYVGLSGMYTKDSRPNVKKWDLGFVNCAGVGYHFYKNLAVNIEAKYYRGFLDAHNTGSEYFKQPIYNQFVELAAGVSYTFNFKK